MDDSHCGGLHAVRPSTKETVHVVDFTAGDTYFEWLYGPLFDLD